MPAAKEGPLGLLQAHVGDLCRFVENRGIPRFTDFLDEAAAAAAENAARAQGCPHLWYGGYESASRRLLGLFPPWQEPETGLFPITALRTKMPKGDTLTHRDFLGAALALGIKREVVGDILITEESAILFALPQAGELIRRDLSRVGRAGVCFEPVALGDISYTQRFLESEKSVSSLRLDCVVSALSNCSRGEAAEKIALGLVSVDGLTEEKGTRKLSGGERVSIRGEGKFIVDSDGRMTRKGRQLIQIKRFV